MGKPSESIDRIIGKLTKASLKIWKGNMPFSIQEFFTKEELRDEEVSMQHALRHLEALGYVVFAGSCLPSNPDRNGHGSGQFRLFRLTPNSLVELKKRRQVAIKIELRLQELRRIAEHEGILPRSQWRTTPDDAGKNHLRDTGGFFALNLN